MHDSESQLRRTLLEKSWFGFDFDDTLHDYRGASAAATKAMLRVIADRYDVPLGPLQEHYGKTLREHTHNAFIDGRTSQDYRKERFARGLARSSLPIDEDFIQELLDAYEAGMMDSLRLKSVTVELLQTLKGKGKQIVIITEGPQDAQERAVEALGLLPYIDMLATSNAFKLSKTSGLFEAVIQKLAIPAESLVFIGDSMERDITPARAAGILCVHYNEGLEAAPDADPPHIQSFVDLLRILNASH